MKPFFLVFTIFISNLSQAAVDVSQVKVAYCTDIKGQQSRRKEHPVKIGRCWGKDTEWISEPVESKFSTEDLHLERKQIKFKSIHPQIREHLVQTLSYDAEYSPDEKFRLRFSTVGGQTETDNSSTNCNSTKTQSSILSTESRFSAKAIIVVPKNVYVLHIKNTKSLIAPGLKNNVQARSAYYPDFATSLKENHAVRFNTAEQVLPLVPGQSNFLLVRPGDLIEATVDYDVNTQEAQDIDFEWEINLLGNKNCDQILAKPSDSFSATSVFASLTKDTGAQIGFEQYISKLSCLRQPTYVRELMINSSGQAMSSFIEKLNTWVQASSQFPKMYTILGRQIARLTLFDLSEALLEDLQSYCRIDTLPSIFGLPNEFKAQIRGYHSAARSYLKISYLLNLGNNPFVDKFIQKNEELVKTGSTYKEALGNQQLIQYLRQAQFDLYTRDIRVYDSIAATLKDIPKTQTGSNRAVQLADAIRDAQSTSETAAHEIKNILIAYSEASLDQINVKPLQNAWYRLKVRRSEIEKLMQEDLEWFKAEQSDSGSFDTTRTQFTSDLSMLNVQIYRAIYDLFNGQPISREVFFKSGYTDSDGRIDSAHVEELSASISQCLESSTVEREKK